MRRIQPRHPGTSLSTSGGRLPPVRRSPSVVVIEDIAELEQYVPAWEALAAAALEPNVFYEPWMLLPAIRAFGAKSRLRFVLVWDGDPLRSGDAGRLLGFFPFERPGDYPWLPSRTFHLWNHRHCYLGVPLLRADAAVDCLAALFGWLAADPRGAALVEFPWITTEGPFHALLSDYLDEHHRPALITNTFRRALLRPRKNGRPLPSEVLSSGRRKSLRSKERRLAEQGPLAYVPLDAGGEIETWIEDFLRCEASGWKVRAGTALACSASDQVYFRTIMKVAFDRGRLVALALQCGGRPIALRCTFLAGAGAFAFKTAHDEAYASFAPGVLLEAETMFRLHALPAVDWVDSCTAPDNFLLNSLWPERRAIHTVLVPTGRRLGDLAIHTLTGLRKLKRRLASLRPFPRRHDDQRKPLHDKQSRSSATSRGSRPSPGSPAECTGH